LAKKSLQKKWLKRLSLHPAELLGKNFENASCTSARNWIAHTIEAGKKYFGKFEIGVQVPYPPLCLQLQNLGNNFSKWSWRRASNPLGIRKSKGYFFKKIAL